MTRPDFRTVISGLLLVAGATVFVVLFVRLWPFMTDDTFISVRYAKNLVEGHGLVYNPGERVEGYTNFLWTLWLAIPLALGLPLAPFIKISNMLLTLATAVLLARLGARTLLSRDPKSDEAPDSATGISLLAMLPAALFLATPNVALGAADGLETALFGFLLMLATWWFLSESVERRVPRSGLALAALAMTRPDGALFAGWFVIAALLLRRPMGYVVRLAAVFGIVFGTYFAARALYYGHLLPNTFYAKGGGDTLLLERGWAELKRFLVESGGWVWLLIPAACIHRRTRGAAIVLCGAVVVRLLFQLWSGGPWMGRYRFLIPALPIVDLLIVAGIVQLIRGRVARVIALTAVCAVILAAGWAIYPRWEMFSLGYGSALRRAHMALGQAISAHTRSDAVMAMDDAGIGPLVADRRNIDMLGLNDEHIAHLPGRYAEKYDVPYVLGRQPDLIVLLSRVERPSRDEDFNLVGHAALFRDEEFQSRYRFVRSYMFDLDYYLLVYRRLDSLAVPADF